MGSHSTKQAKVMSAIAHGWKPKGSAAGIPVGVAKEFHAADGKAHRMYGKGRPGVDGPDPHSRHGKIHTGGSPADDTGLGRGVVGPGKRMERSVAAADVALPHTVAGKQMDNWLKHQPKAAHGHDRMPPKLGAYPAPAKEAHGYGHDHRSGHERLSGDGRAHRIGKR